MSFTAPIQLPGLTRDPTWYKRAVFYEVMVRSFVDSNGDGTGRPRRACLPARLPAVARHRLALAAALLPVAAARRRLRHLRLQGGAAGVRHHRRVPRPGAPGARAEHAHRHGLPAEPHVRRARVVPAVAQRPRGAVRRLLRLERHRREVPGHPDHLRGHRGVELGVRPRAPAVLLPPLLQPPARPELREPGGAARRSSTSSGSGSTSASTACGSTRSPTSSRARRATARASRRPTSSSSGCASTSTASTRAASCSRRRTSGRARSPRSSAPRRSRSATWRSTSP